MKKIEWWGFVDLVKTVVGFVILVVVLVLLFKMGGWRVATSVFVSFATGVWVGVATANVNKGLEKIRGKKGIVA